MVIKSRIRGGGRALASYLLALGQNEQVRILDVDGMSRFSDKDLKNLLGDFSLNEQLTRSRQGIYHATVNPAESETMRDEDWLRATDILAEELGFSGQRRAIVLHRKHGRTHGHVAFERYSHDTGKMLGIAHNYRKQDKARARMEQEFNQRPTARRNPDREVMKERLTGIWKTTRDAGSFIKAARTEGYQIANGHGRIPYMVVDGNRAFNLIRHLDGIKTKEVRDRLKDTVLLSEREAMAFARTQRQVTHKDTYQTKPQPAKPEVATTEQDLPGKEKSARESFSENLAKLRTQQQAQRMKGLRPR